MSLGSRSSISLRSCSNPARRVAETRVYTSQSGPGIQLNRRRVRMDLDLEPPGGPGAHLIPVLKSALAQSFAEPRGALPVRAIPARRITARMIAAEFRVGQFVGIPHPARVGMTIGASTPTTVSAEAIESTQFKISPMSVSSRRSSRCRDTPVHSNAASPLGLPCHPKSIPRKRISHLIVTRDRLVV